MPASHFASLRAVDVFAAAKRLRGVARRTALRHSPALSAVAGGPVYLKMENEQLTGSFKLRGAFNSVAALPAAARAHGVVTASAGNHGLGVAWAARHFGISATIFIPATAPAVKRQGISALGARVDDAQPHYDAAHAAALAAARESGARFIDPCAGAFTLAGQGTVALEVLEELPDVAALVVSVGGGGLLAGMASLVRRVAPHVRVLGVQGDRTAAMARSLAAGRVVEVEVEATLADGLAGQIDDVALDYGRAGLDEIVLVDEEEIAAAIRWLAQEEQAVVEGSGAVGVAAVLGRKLSALPTPAVVVLSGGNIDRERHEAIVRGG